MRVTRIVFEAGYVTVYSDVGPANKYPIRKFLEGAVATLDLADKLVTVAKMADMGGEAHVLIADASNRPVSKAVSSDITIDKDGVVTIANDVVTDSKLHEDIKYWRLHRGGGDLIQRGAQGNVGYTDLDCSDPAFRSHGIITPNGAIGIIVQIQILDGDGSGMCLKLRKNGETNAYRIFYLNAIVQSKTIICMAIVELDDSQIMEWSISGATGSLCSFSLKLMGWVMQP